MDDRTAIVITALVLLTILMCVALYLGMNGTLLASVIGILAFAVGVPAGITLERRLP